MMIIDRYIALWLFGILLGGGTIMFGFWQMDWVTPFAGLNLELVTLWLDFATIVAFYNKSRTWTISLLGVSLVPLAGAFSLLALFDHDMLQTKLANLMGGLILPLLISFLVIYASAMDFLPKVETSTSEARVA